MDFFRQFRKKNLDAVPGWTKAEILAYFATDGLLIPDRFKDLPTEKSATIIDNFINNRPTEVNK